MQMKSIHHVAAIAEDFKVVDNPRERIASLNRLTLKLKQRVLIFKKLITISKNKYWKIAAIKLILRHAIIRWKSGFCSH